MRAYSTCTVTSDWVQSCLNNGLVHDAVNVYMRTTSSFQFVFVVHMKDLCTAHTLLLQGIHAVVDMRSMFMESLSTGDLTHNMAKKYLFDVEHLGYCVVPNMSSLMIR